MVGYAAPEWSHSVKSQQTVDLRLAATCLEGDLLLGETLPVCASHS